jgi:hypothetical protein
MVKKNKKDDKNRRKYEGEKKYGTGVTLKEWG